jgi:hypothetical protein
MPPDAPETVLAYQRLRLREIRAMCEQQHLEIDHYTEVEKNISKEIGSLDIEFSEVRQTLTSLGVELDGRGDIRVPDRHLAPLRPKSHSEKTPPSIDFKEVVAEVYLYLTETGVDPNKDPLLQLLGDSEASDINRRYREAFGEVTWDQSDYLAILLAGFIATLLDVFLVRIPLDGAFLGRMQAGSPMTRWIRQNSKPVHDHYLKDLEKAAKVPYDLSAAKAVDGLSPKVHRLMSLGHDPILAFIFGVMDVMSGTGTYIDKQGNLHRIDQPAPAVCCGMPNQPITPTQLHVLVVRSACRERAIPAERVGSEAVVVDYYVRTEPHDAPIRWRDQRCITNNCTAACGSPDSPIGYVAV